ncbi:hypothetical protein BDL97_02G100600 [Sphagnum fallax]|nr:hypothetical protein BDL97_02G100600 [Sphagnum fallax]
MALLCCSLAHLHITQIVDSQSSSRNRRSSLPSHSAHICIHSSNSGGCGSRVCCNSLGNGINGLKDGMDFSRIRVLHSPPRSQKRSQQKRKRCIVVMQNNSGGGGDITKEVVVKESTSDRREEGSLETTQIVEDPRKSILSILCPLLKFFGGGDPAAPRNALLETATTGVSSIARLPWGSQVLPEVAAARAESGQPPQLFQLYEFEACPFCRRVREALTELDLSAEVYPCPKGSIRHREFVRSVGGREQFPYFLDPNTGVSMYESSDIVRYLFSKYGQGRQPSPGLLESTLVTGWVPTLMRAGRGMSLYARATLQPPHKKLELFSYENNQFARLVRETLCELELPYILRNSGKGSSCRPALLQIAGSTKVPFLVDPNTGVSMGESKDIIAYLFQTYGGSTPNPVAG